MTQLRLKLHFVGTLLLIASLLLAAAVDQCQMLRAGLGMSVYQFGIGAEGLLDQLGWTHFSLSLGGPGRRRRYMP